MNESVKHPPKVFNTAQEILQWDPKSADPLTVSNVPLLTPRVNPQEVLMLVGLDNGPWTYWSEFDANPQGGDRGNVYNFQYWQYVDSIYYYVHSLAAVPPVMWIDAAHRNGVKIFAAITGDCDTCAEQFNELLKTPEGAARQLYLIAKTYGFDGWLFDVENGVEAGKNLQTIMRLRPTNSDAGYYEGGRYQIDDHTWPFFQAGTFLQSDYTQWPGYPERTYNFLKSKDATSQRFKAYWSVYVYQYETSDTPNPLFNGYAYLDVEGFFKQLGQARQSNTPPKYYQSLGIYAPGWTMYGGHNSTSDPLPSRDQFHETDRKFWVGDGASVTPDGVILTSQAAVANFIEPRSSIVTLPFVIRFNTGEGSFFSVFGQRLAADEWCHLGCQDRLPTWCCPVAGAPGNVDASISYEDAYDGGSALAFRGTLPGKQQVEFPLFLTQTQLEQNTQVRVTYKIGQNSLAPYLKLTFSDGSSYTVSGEKGTGWVRTMGKPGTAKQMVRMSLGFSNSGGTDATVHALIGEIAVYTPIIMPPPALISLVRSGDMLTWTAPDFWPIWYYNVVCKKGASLALVGRAFLPQYDLSAALFPKITGDTYIVQPVTTSGNHSDLPAAQNK
jgi:endo-beta-N-acetylglucosaminidase D